MKKFLTALLILSLLICTVYATGTEMPKIVDKARKTTVFELKTVVFMVAEAGLEPTTSGL